MTDNLEPLEQATESPGKFPIVGMGASAGGLEAFEQFFRHVQPDSNMGFVIISHLDPRHASILTEILQRSSNMPVIEAVDQMQVQPDHVYVIPPNRDMAIFHGVLQLSVPEQPRGQRMPIDAFFRTLAEDQGENAVGIILSGTGTDGTLGLRAILGAGGVSLVQEPATARYDGMPDSAIRAGYATQVLPVDKMPQALMTGISYQPPIPSAEITDGINRILVQLRSVTGHDFSQYKKSTISRCIARRMVMHDIGSLDSYARHLKEFPEEVILLFKELLINVTSFFRDPEAFAALKAEVLPQLFENKPEDYVFRVWVAGCATGEEAYSIAILFCEYMEDIRQEFKILLFATDLDDDAITTARAGFYLASIAQDMSEERLRRFFIREDAGFRVKKHLREIVVFAIQNVIKDPPFTKLDLLSCRNLMIYLEQEVQRHLIPAFHYALKPGGMLFLSPSESIGNYPELFSVFNRKWKFYRASGALTSTAAAMTGGLVWTRNSKGSDEVTIKPRLTNFTELPRRLLLQFYASASVVTDEQGNVLYVHGDTGHYLRPPPGQAMLNLVEMARDGLKLPLRKAVGLAVEKDTGTLNHEVQLKTNDKLHGVCFSVRPIPGSDSRQKLLLISFRLPRARPYAAARRYLPIARIDELERELAYSRENLQGTIEEQQASNEELQSTNEELETSKEELQSVNEELLTVNAELQAKIEQLTMMQNDMKNLLDNINIGTLFLDSNLCIKRITQDAMKIYRLVASDLGRPLADIKSNIEGRDLLRDAKIVLDTLVPFECEVNTIDASYLAHIQPYRTLDNVIDGVVLTFTDISSRVAAEVAVRKAKDLAEGIVCTVREPLIVLDEQLRVIRAGNAFYQYFRATRQDTEGCLIYQLGDSQWDIPALRELLENRLPQNQFFDGFLVEQDFPLIGHKKLLLSGRRIVDDGDSLILLVIEESS